MPKPTITVWQSHGFWLQLFPRLSICWSMTHGSNWFIYQCQSILNIHKYFSNRKNYSVHFLLWRNRPKFHHKPPALIFTNKRQFIIIPMIWSLGKCWFGWAPLSQSEIFSCSHQLVWEDCGAKNVLLSIAATIEDSFEVILSFQKQLGCKDN